MTDKEIIDIITNHGKIQDRNPGNVSFHFLKAEIEFPVLFENCDITVLEADCVTFNNRLSFINCRIGKMKLHGSNINSGLTISNCVVSNYVDMSSAIIYSGKNEIAITDNLFKSVVTFEDCSFHNLISITGNTFEVGCDLLTEKQLGCSFPEESIVKNNTGNLRLSTKEEDLLWKKIRNL